MKITRNKTCRICKSKQLKKFLDLGNIAPVNNLLKKEQLSLYEHVPNLSIYVCTNCWLVQIIDVMDPGELFLNNYPYFTSFISTMTKHFHELASEITGRFNLQDTDLVVDIGSNDGAFLSGFKKHGKSVLGIEPAPNVAAVAKAKGIDTLNIFFTKKNAAKIRKERGPAKVIVSTNTFAHVNDLDDFVSGVQALLEEDGVFIFENPYLVDVLLADQFDTMYYEHLCHYSIHPLKALFDRFQMEIFDVQRTKVHAGSILVFVKNKESQIPSTSAVEKLLALERNMGIDTLKPYLEFAKRVERFKEKLSTVLKKLKEENKTIVGYGASARGNVLLSYCRIGTNILDYTMDRSTFKQGLYTPGTHIPILAPEKLIQDMPDYVLLIAWSFADEIMKQQSEYRKRGGKFIIPFPSVNIV